MDKEKAFQRKVEELIRKAGRAEDNEVRWAVRLLNDTRKDVVARIATTDWQAYHLPQLKSAIDRAMQEFGDKYGVRLLEAERDFWAQGIEIVDLPLRTVGVFASIPEIDTTILHVMQDFAMDRVKGLTRDGAEKIKSEITRGLLGQKSPYDVIQGVGKNLKDKSIFRSIAERAEVITRNECGRVLEAAGQKRREKAAEVVPGLQKQWVHGEGSRFPRITHLMAHGQIRNVDEPFMVGGDPLMYPRDPGGSAKNTINCRCFSIPYHPSWGEPGLGKYDDYVDNKKRELGLIPGEFEERTAAAN